jgi:hypothetical protein
MGECMVRSLNRLAMSWKVALTSAISLLWRKYGFWLERDRVGSVLGGNGTCSVSEEVK